MLVFSVTIEVSSNGNKRGNQRCNHMDQCQLLPGFRLVANLMEAEAQTGILVLLSCSNTIF